VPRFGVDDLITRTKGLDDIYDKVAPLPADPATEAKQDAIEAKLDLPAADETANTRIGEVIGQKGDAANETANQASVIGLLRAVIDTYLSDGTIGLANLKVLIDAIEGKLDDGTTGLANIKALIDAVEEATLTAIKGAGWTDENLTTIDSLIDAIKAVTDNLPDGGALTTLITHLTDIKGAGWTALTTIQADLDNPDQYKADVAALALEATLTAIKGAGWTDESLKAIKDAIDTIAGVNTYQEQIPDTDFSLAAIDNTLTADPPNADAENSVVDIDAVAGSTFVLRSLFVNITSFGTGTKLTFGLWVPVDGAITEVDTVDVTATGFQNLADIFGLQEVHADSIHITVITDVGNTGACSGTYRYAKAS